MPLSAALSTASSLSYLGLPGHLVTITSAEENTFVAALCREACWIGGSDEAQEGAWRWITGPEKGRLIDPTFWNAGEPNGGSGENFITSTWNQPQKWNDSPSSSALYFVVEYDTCKLNHLPVVSSCVDAFRLCRCLLVRESHLRDRQYQGVF